MTRRIRRWLLVGAFAGVVAAAAGGFAFARATADGTISACAQKEVGSLRLAPADGCRPSEVPVQWSQTGPQGPPGPKGDTGPSDAWEFYVLKGFTNPDAWIPIGTSRANLTDILTFHLDGGNYVVSTQVLAGDWTGNGTLVCRTGNNALGGFSIGQTSLGNGPGHSIQTYLNFSTTFPVPAGGGDLTLSCWLAPDSGDPGSPRVGLGDVIVTKVGAIH